jgi:hypothetical protein
MKHWCVFDASRYKRSALPDAGIFDRSEILTTLSAAGVHRRSRKEALMEPLKSNNTLNLFPSLNIQDRSRLSFLGTRGRNSDSPAAMTVVAYRNRT